MLVLAAAIAALPNSLVARNSLSLDAADHVAQAALADCRAGGFHVAVAVVDADGIEQVVLRDDAAGVHLLDAARRKAFTAASSGSPTSVWETAVRERTGVPDPNIGDVKDVLLIGGGVPIRFGREVVGAVGVAGSPGIQLDERCARAGIASVPLP